jgi:hypothetical protein
MFWQDDINAFCHWIAVNDLEGIVYTRCVYVKYLHFTYDAGMRIVSN